LQVEINRALYLDEASLERTAGFERLSATVAWLVDHLIAAWPVTLPRPEIPRLAAE
jgi:N-formylglutamate amidohydrolase